MAGLEDILGRYKAGTYSPSDLKHMEALLYEGTLTLETLGDVTEILQAMSHEPQPASVDRMDEAFYQNISPTTSPIQKSRLNKWIIALSVISIILTGLCIYLLGQLNADSSLRHELAPHEFASSLLHIEQTEERIRLVTNIAVEEHITDDILDALLYNLISDESTNVRLASINTLKGYVNNPFVRQGLINAIPFQESPIILMYIKEAIAQSGHKMEAEDFTARVNPRTRPEFDQSLQSTSL